MLQHQQQEKLQKQQQQQERRQRRQQRRQQLQQEYKQEQEQEKEQDQSAAAPATPAISEAPATPVPEDGAYWSSDEELNDEMAAERSERLSMAFPEAFSLSRGSLCGSAVFAASREKNDKAILKVQDLALQTEELALKEDLSLKEATIDRLAMFGGEHSDKEDFCDDAKRGESGEDADADTSQAAEQRRKVAALFPDHEDIINQLPAEALPDTQTCKCKHKYTKIFVSADGNSTLKIEVRLRSKTIRAFVEGKSSQSHSWTTTASFTEAIVAAIRDCYPTGKRSKILRFLPQVP
eukprot:TRINITY_DN14421_c0_g7_i1.p1 TRINITY_DN14421_c0_g7~~TRINITY_DN14421_c0_g7_i1.p1  ORF type:complete len:294 (+),score=96.18 TRINITY_DN14421_c0_g7_i1:297-1178(+)